MHDRRSILKAIGVCGTTTSIAAGRGVAGAAESADQQEGRTVRLVKLGLVHNVTPQDDRLRVAEAHVDQFTQYSVQDETLIVYSERAENRVSFNGFVASPQNLGQETFQSLAGSIQLAGVNDYLVTEFTPGFSPTKVVSIDSNRNTPTASVRRAGRDDLEVEFQGETRTVATMEIATIEASGRSMKVEVTDGTEGDRRFAEASVVPTLHVKNFGELKYHSMV